MLNDEPLYAGERFELQFEYEYLFENMTQGIVYQNSKGEILRANKAAQEILGLTLSQLQGKTSMDPNWQAIKADGSPFPGNEHPAMVTLQTGAIIKNVEMGVFVPQRGKYTWILVSSQPIFDDESDKPTRVFATFTDITKQKETEKLLLSKQKQEKILIKNIPGIGYTLDEDFNLNFVSNKIFEIFNLPTNASISETILKDVIHLEDVENVFSQKKQAIASKTRFEIEYRIILSNNEVKIVRDIGEGIFEGDKLVQIVGFVQDISNDRIQISKLESTITILKESGKVAKIGYWEGDIMTGKLFWLPETYRLFGRSETNQPTMEDVFKYYQNKENFQEAIQLAITEGKDYDIETEIVTEQGEKRWFRTIGKTEFVDGNCTKIFGLVQDITDYNSSVTKLKQQAVLQDLLIEISNTLISLRKEKIPNAINESLVKLGKHSKADRFYIFNYNPESNCVSNTYEWCEKGIEPQIEALQNISMEGMEEWTSSHKKGLPFIIEDVSKLPDDSVARSILEPQGIKSIATFPLFQGGEYAGFIGLDFVSDFSKIKDDEIALLKLFAKLLDNVFERVSNYQNLFYYKNLLYDVAENSETLIYQKDIFGNYELVNKSFETTVGLSRDEIIGKKDSEIFEKANANEFSQNDKKVLQSENALSTIETFLCNGKRRFYTSTKFPVIGPNGEIHGIVGLSHDITKEKEIQFSLEKSEAMLASTLDASIANIWSVDRKYNIIYFNKNFESYFLKFYGFPPQINTPYLNSLPEDVRKYWTNLFDLALEGKSSQIDSYKELQDGSLLEFVISVKPMVSNKQIIGASVYVVDVTQERKRFQENLRFSKIFEETLNEVYLFDCETLQFKQANKAGLKNLGYSQKELLSMHVYDIKPDYTKDRFQKLARDFKKNTDKNLFFETLHQRKDGSTYPVEIYLQVVDFGEEQLFMAFANDISDKKMYLSKLEKQNEILRSINWTQSHVVRMPLTRIMGLTEFLENEFFEELSYPEIISEIKKSTEEIDKVVKDIVAKAHEAKHIDESLSLEKN